MRAPLSLLVLASLLLAGCLGTPAADVEASATDAASLVSATPPVVIAVIDSGANPYHVAFRGGPTFADVVGLPADAAALPLTFDAQSYDAAVAADAHLWAGVDEGELVWFPGTRLAAVSISKLDESRFHVLDDGGHGTPVSHAALAAAPHAVVVLVQAHDDEGLPAALEWVAKQAWIDVVSVSWGMHPGEYVEGEVMMGLVDAHREVVRAGKLVLNAAGNYPWPQASQEHSGPAFVIAVGGARENVRGDAWLASRFPDVVGEFVHEARAVAGTLDETSVAAGTSFACPQVAGSVAEALWRVREAVGAQAGGVTPAGALVEAQGGGALADGALTAAELREAMNRAALHWEPGDWTPPPTGEDPFWTALLAGAPVVAPAAQVGWGWVGPEQSAPIADDLLGVQPLPDKPADVQAFMRANLEARRAVWGDA